MGSTKDKVGSGFEEFLSLHEFRGMVRLTSDPDEVLKHLKTLLSKLYDYEIVSVYLFDVLGNLAPSGLKDSQLFRLVDERVRKGVIDELMGKGDTATVPLSEEDRLLLGGTAESLILSPLAVGTLRLGVIFSVSSRRPSSFTEIDLKIVQFIADHAAISLSNAISFREATKAKRFLSNILENAGEIIFSLDRGGRISYLNSRIEDLKLKRDDLLGEHYSGLFSDRGVQKRIASALRREKGVDFECQFGLGTSPGRQFAVNLTPLREGSNYTGVLGIMSDVTDAVKEHEELLKSARLAVYRQTVMALNHEVNNPLTTIMGNLHLLKKEIEKIADGGSRRRLEVIRENCLRVQRVIERMGELEELKTISYLDGTKMIDLGDGS